MVRPRLPLAPSLRRTFTQWLTELTDTRLCVYATLLVLGALYVCCLFGFSSPRYWEVGWIMALMGMACFGMFIVPLTPLLFGALVLIERRWPAPPARRPLLLVTPALLIMLCLLSLAAWDTVPWIAVHRHLGSAVKHLHATRYAHLEALLTQRAYCQWEGEFAAADLAAFCRKHELQPVEGEEVRTYLERDIFAPPWAKPEAFPASATFYYRVVHGPGDYHHWMLIWDAASKRGWYINIYQS